MKPRNKSESHWQFQFNDGRRICVNTMRDSRRTKRGMRKQRRRTEKEMLEEELEATFIEPEKEPWQLPEYGQHDQGIWAASVDGKYIESSDFTHDVRLEVGGDFVDGAQRKKYAENIAKRLNATKPEASEVESENN